MSCNKSGFSLIELAIVLVVIGLLLGVLIKGQEMIDGAKAKKLAVDFRNIPDYIYSYQDKYKALPGDDARLTNHLGASVTPCTPAAVGHCAPGNGAIDGGWDAATPADETFVFWQHLRLAGFGTEQTTTSSPDYRPRNAVYGFIGVANAAQSPVIGIKGSYIVCSDGIPGKIARRLDKTLDDGNTQTGSMMVVAAGTLTAKPAAAVATLTIVDDADYLVCMGY